MKSHIHGQDKKITQLEAITRSQADVMSRQAQTIGKLQRDVDGQAGLSSCIS